MMLLKALREARAAHPSQGWTIDHWETPSALLVVRDLKHRAERQFAAKPEPITGFDDPNDWAYIERRDALIEARAEREAKERF